MNITDLCDHVLIKIFSFLDLYDKYVILPEVCDRFATINLPTITKFESKDLLNEKWKSYRNVTKLFNKVGSGLDKFKIHYSFQKTKKKNHLSLMLKQVRRNCLNLKTLHIQPAIKLVHVQNLPKTIRKLVIENFFENSLDLKYMKNLRTLHLGLHDDIPDGFAWIKVKNRLKEMQLHLEFEQIPFNVVRINQLLSSVSDNSSVHLSLFPNVRLFRQRINSYDFMHISSLKELSICGYDVHGEDINKLLCFLAEKNSVTSITITSNSFLTSPIITTKTIDMLLKWTVLDKLSFGNNDCTHSLVAAFVKKLELKNIRLQYGYLAFDDGCSTDLPISRLTEFIEFFTNFDDFDYFPKLHKISFELEIEEQDKWELFSKTFLQTAPQIAWTPPEFLYLELEAET